jgi:hypothetical protein
MRKLPIKTATIVLEGDYEGWELVCRTNPPMSMLQELASGDFKTLMATLPKLIISWNFVDEEGEYIGDPSEVTIAKLPTELIMGVLNKITDKISSAPSPNF